MAFSYFKVLKFVRRSIPIHFNSYCYYSNCNELKLPKLLVKEFRNEKNLTYLHDPDTFGKLSVKIDKVEDDGDIKEELFLKNKSLESQKLTTKQYADLIKQFIKLKRVKEAIDVLEVKMLKQDQVKPVNYIYNILIGGCADVGYTKKAFKLYNDMKRRSLKPTGDTYTCLFEACSNSPWPQDGLKNAKHLRELMLEKKIEPNLTNYNAMVKAFGRCGDLITAFKLIDEMKAKNIKIRVHTCNHLLHACITDKDFGLRYAIMVWRKMLQLREKPNIYTFNLMLKCVKDCNIGSKDDLKQLINLIKDNMQIESGTQELQIESPKLFLSSNHYEDEKETIKSSNVNYSIADKVIEYKSGNERINQNEFMDLQNTIKLEFVDKSIIKSPTLYKEVPNLLSKNIQMSQILALKYVHTPQEKFAIIGGMDGFLKEMSNYSVNPDIKTFTQMLPLVEDIETEAKILRVMKTLNIKTDIEFYNMLIKSRCYRKEYDAAFVSMQMKDIGYVA